MNSILKYTAMALVGATALAGCKDAGKGSASIPYGTTVTIDKATLLDKIKGGWAAQTIGCTYGGPTEFKYKGGMINDSIPIIWYDDYCKYIFAEDPGLYDDVYMDLTFMEVMAREGIDAPASSFADAFANADYKLWHANQAARYNILNGVMPPASGHWKNNPHADDIDFQIEADFIGMICPGMPNVSSAFADRIGHIMNYGDGFYGGVYVAALYTLAYVCDDIPTVVEQALQTIPAEANFRRCIEDVISFWRRNPSDWKQCWLAIDQKYTAEKGCPEGVWNGFDIDATINAAYCVIGLLYGEGDFFRTLDISTRCGQDSDCNPATAGGILGVMMGYEALPAKWKPAVERCENIDFPYTSISLATSYDITLDLLEKVVVANGGNVTDDAVSFSIERPVAVALEQSFEGIKPVERRVVKLDLDPEYTWDFNGSGIVLQGLVRRDDKSAPDDYVARLEASVDGKVVDTFAMPLDYITRKYDIFHTYDLSDGPHKLTVRWLNPTRGYAVQCKDIVVYGSE